jgi:pimeloyl-ACP methyl ester carboxylesterase
LPRKLTILLRQHFANPSLFWRTLVATLATGTSSMALSQIPFSNDLGPAITVAQVLGKPSSPTPVTWRETRRDGRGVEYQTEFPSAMRTSIPVNNRVPLLLLLPSGANAAEGRRYPVVFVLHYLGAKDLRAERQLGKELNRRGLAAALIELPYHLSRAPEGTRSGELAVQPDPTVLTSTMVQSVLDVRRALDIVRLRPDVEPDEFGIAGISLGSLVAELVFGIEPRFVRAGFLLGGTNLAHILWTSSRVIVSRAQLRSDGYTEEKLRVALAPIEPETYLRRRMALHPKETNNALTIGGRFDTVVPPSAFKSLVASLPSPTVVTLNTGHYGGIFVQQKLLSEVAEYFADSTSGRPYFAPKDIQAPTLRLVAQAMTPTGFDIGIGIDFFRTSSNHQTFGTLVLTVRGAEIFLGQSVGSGLAVGGIASTHGLAAGIFWSSVL